MHDYQGSVETWSREACRAVITRRVYDMPAPNEVLRIIKRDVEQKTLATFDAVFNEMGRVNATSANSGV